MSKTPKSRLKILSAAVGISLWIALLVGCGVWVATASFHKAWVAAVFTGIAALLFTAVVVLCTVFLDWIEEV